MHDAPPIFDSQRRARMRLRAGRMKHREDDGLTDVRSLIAADLLDRLDDHRGPFSRALLIGALTPAIAAALRARGMRLDIVEPSPELAATIAAAPQREDELDVEPGSYDLILWPGGLDSVDDVPGALLRMRLALAPGGTLLGVCAGEGSFATLRDALAVAERGRRAARMHPQISLAALADLMQRCGFAGPVVDGDRYPLAPAPLADRARQLRTAGLGQALPQVARLPRDVARSVDAHVSTSGDTLVLLHFAGHAPRGDEPVRAAPRSPFI